MMLGRFLGGWKNSSCDLLEVENCRDVWMVKGLRMAWLGRRPMAAAGDEAKPLLAALPRLAERVEGKTALEGFIAV